MLVQTLTYICCIVLLWRIFMSGVPVAHLVGQHFRTNWAGQVKSVYKECVASIGWNPSNAGCTGASTPLALHAPGSACWTIEPFESCYFLTVSALSVKCSASKHPWFSKKKEKVLVQSMHANLETIRQIATHKSCDAQPKSEVAQIQAWAFLAAAIHALLEYGMPSLTSCGSSSA